MLLYLYKIIMERNLHALDGVVIKLENQKP